MSQVVIISVVVQSPRKLCMFLLSRKYNSRHRMSAGFFVMAAGVAVAQHGADVLTFPGGHFIADAVGYAIHGMGCLPIIDWLVGNDD